MLYIQVLTGAFVSFVVHLVGNSSLLPPSSHFPLEAMLHADLVQGNSLVIASHVNTDMHCLTFPTKSGNCNFHVWSLG